MNQSFIKGKYYLKDFLKHGYIGEFIYETTEKDPKKRMFIFRNGNTTSWFPYDDKSVYTEVEIFPKTKITEPPTANKPKRTYNFSTANRPDFIDENNYGDKSKDIDGAKDNIIGDDQLGGMSRRRKLRKSCFRNTRKRKTRR
jgi:hypothetical protein